MTLNTKCTATAIVAILIALACALSYRCFTLYDNEAYIYVPEGTVIAEWQYRQFPMKECAWCGSKLSLERHHVLPWSASPELENEPTNIVVLCKPDHLRVAHGGNYKRFNANLLETLKTARWVNSNEYYRETHGGNERTEVRK